MTCVPQVDEEPVKKEEEKKKELKPWEIDTLPDDSDSEDPPDKEWEVTVKWLTVRSYTPTHLCINGPDEASS